MTKRTNILNRLSTDPELYKKFLREYLEVCTKLPRPLIQHHKEKLGKQTLCISDSERRRWYVWQFPESFSVSVHNDGGIVFEMDENLNPWTVWEIYRHRIGA